MRMTRFSLVSFTAFLLTGVVPALAQADWQVVKTFQIGGEGSWDYLTVDPHTHRLYVPRSTHTMVIDGETGMSCPPRDVGRLATAIRAVLDDPAAAQRRARGARPRLTTDMDWHTVAQETAQVYLSAKRRERQPQPRLPISEHALPDR